jgi:hypothetical protein
MASKIPVSIASLQWLLELSLDDAATYEDGVLPAELRKRWALVEYVWEHPVITEKCKSLDRKTLDYLHSLIADFHAAVIHAPEKKDAHQPELFEPALCA